MGNPTQITGTIVGQPYTATFSYQDPQYFLTQGNGPWGTRAWTYDRIGNRLTHQESGEPTQTYTYAGSGHNPKLLQITPAPGLGTGIRQYAYDAAGNQTSVQETDEEGTFEATFLDASPESRLSALRPTTAPGRTDMLYDGRGYLRQAHLTFTGSLEDVKITPAYSSEGLLMSRTEERHWSGGTPGPDGEDSIWLVSNDETTHLFYFAGRPVAQLTDGALFYITTDHLGTPVLITNTSGSPVWAGGLEPFGRPWTAGGNPDPEPLTISSQTDKGLSRLSSESAFLRYPGQWASDAFRVSGVRMEAYYNVHRYYETSTGRYASSDPLGFQGDSHPYLYASANPILFIDLTGEKARTCCTPVPLAPGPAKHCFIQYRDDKTGNDTTYALHRVKGKGCKYKDDGFDLSGLEDSRTICGPWNEECQKSCLEREFKNYPNPSDYQLIRGPNSNSLARTLTEACGLTPPAIVGQIGQAPGWGSEGRPAKDGNFRCPERR